MDVLLGKTLWELQAVAEQVGLPKFAGKQLAEWLYVRRARTFDEMTNISLKGREALKAAFEIGRHAPVREAKSIDGTRKFLFRVESLAVCDRKRYIYRKRTEGRCVYRRKRDVRWGVSSA